MSIRSRIAMIADPKKNIRNSQNRHPNSIPDSRILDVESA